MHDHDELVARIHASGTGSGEIGGQKGLEDRGAASAAGQVGHGRIAGGVGFGRGAVGCVPQEAVAARAVDVPAAADGPGEQEQAVAAGGGRLDPPDPSARRDDPAVENSAATTNRKVREIVRAFAWLESEIHVEPGTAAHLETVGRLKGQKPAKKRTVADDHLAAILPYCAPPVAAMLQLQRMTAARPGEFMILRPMDIDQAAGPDVWAYVPERHKNDWREGENVRVIALGPEAQAILRPFLDRPAGEFCFKPAESWAWHRQQRRAASARKTPVYPCEVKRLARQRASQRRKGGRFRPRFDKDSYCRAVKRAIQRARAGGVDVPDFTPYDLRHTRVSEVWATRGPLEAQAMAGHASPNMTAHYSHQQQIYSFRIAAEEARKAK